MIPGEARMRTNISGFNGYPCAVSALLMAGLLNLSISVSAATNDVIGVYTNWPTIWTPLNGLNDPDDGLLATHTDFVGDTTNPAGYYASTNGYVFFRQRVHANTTDQTTFNNAFFVLINLIGTNYNAGTGEDGYPDYSFVWDGLNNTQISNHGLEMQIRNATNILWEGCSMDDIDLNTGTKKANDINGDNRTTDGYLRVISEQSTTNFSVTTVIDFAVKWSYLQTYTGLNTNQAWKVAFASNIAGANDHEWLTGGDIAGGASPTSPTTNGWTSIWSTPTGSEPLPRPSFFSFF
jgi:hypothetical protein